MSKVLSPWCKKVKKTLIDKDMTIPMLAKAVGLTREYTSAIVNGRAYSDSAIKSINDELDIEDDYLSSI